ncbi:MULTISPECIES: hypothetical protein [Cupriavidus]|uniref:Uncharacterized protein n=1 Tax=Cupriavidus neocaledonicus TaxID=1040979 RepID=A0A375HVB6_9BURK|nr:MULTISPECIES: hypothetical protein [Cupriavidus]MEC3767495.1 hypothetical protein [Cupriavidus sp. SS-3]SOZ39694.1 exported hypothetical protein [Cupriavidus neocaledonicus]SPD60976.1 conserved protein of unknown function [Cupriavidus neocaledonicus]
MRKIFITLGLLTLMAGAYVFVTGLRISFTPSVTITAVKLYATEEDASAQSENFQMLPINTKCYLTKVGSKHNTMRVRCEEPAVEGWIWDFHLFEPPL